MAYRRSPCGHKLRTHALIRKRPGNAAMAQAHHRCVAKQCPQMENYHGSTTLRDDSPPQMPPKLLKPNTRQSASNMEATSISSTSPTLRMSAGQVIVRTVGPKSIGHPRNIGTNLHKRPEPTTKAIRSDTQHRDEMTATTSRPNRLGHIAQPIASRKFAIQVGREPSPSFLGPCQILGSDKKEIDGEALRGCPRAMVSVDGGGRIYLLSLQLRCAWD